MPMLFDSRRFDPVPRVHARMANPGLWCLCLLAACQLVLPAWAQSPATTKAPTAQATAAGAARPPIIDRELFFGDPEISGAQLSPDGRFIAFVTPFKGTRNGW